MTEKAKFKASVCDSVKGIGMCSKENLLAVLVIGKLAVIRFQKLTIILLSTITCSFSTWGKPLRKVSNVFTSSATSKHTFSANTLTLGTIASGLTFFTPACKSA